MKMNRVLSLCLVIVMLLVMLPVTAFAAEAPAIKVSLTLTDSIAINYKVAADDIDDFEKVEFYSGETLLDTVTELPAADANGMYVFSYTDIAPHMMGHVITAKLYADNLTATQDASIFAYCNAALKNAETYGNELAVLAMELLNYGAAAQTYHAAAQETTIVSTDLANYRVAAVYPEIDALCDTSALTYNSVKAVGSELTDPAVVWTGVGLYLSDAISIRYKFTADSVDGLSMKVTSGKNEWTVSEFYAAGEGAWYVYFDELNPAQMRDTVVVTMYDQGQAVSNSVTYSIESYVSSILESTTDETLSALVQEMLRYGNAATAWVESQTPVVNWETVASVDFETGTLAYNYFDSVQGSGAAGELAEDIGYNSSKSFRVNTGTRPKYYKAGASIYAGWYRISGYVYLNGADASKVTVQPWVKQADTTNSITEYALENRIVGEADENGWSYFELDIQQMGYQGNYQVVFNNNSGVAVYFDNFKYEKYLGEGQPTPTAPPAVEVSLWEDVASVDFETGNLAANNCNDVQGSGSAGGVLAENVGYNSSKSLQVNSSARPKYYKAGDTISAGWYRISGYVYLDGADTSKTGVRPWVKNASNSNDTTYYTLDNCNLFEADANGWSYFEVDVYQNFSQPNYQVVFENSSGKAVYFDNFKYERYLGEGQPAATQPPAEETPLWNTIADVDFETGDLAANYFDGTQGSTSTPGSLATTVGYNSSNSLQADNGVRAKYYKAGSIAAGWYRISGYVKLNGADANKVTVQPWVKQADGSNGTTEYALANCIYGPADQNGWNYFQLDVYQNATQTNYQVVFNNNHDSGVTVYIDNFLYEQYLGEGQP